MITLEMMRSRYSELWKQAISANDEEQIGCLKKIAPFLQRDDALDPKNYCYLELGISLLTLKFDDKDAKAMLDNYVKARAEWEESQYKKGLLRYKDDEGNAYAREAMLNPERERYYRFEDGTIFKIRDGTEYYWLDRDNEWSYDGDLQRKIYDAQYDYETIGYTMIEDQ